MCEARPFFCRHVTGARGRASRCAGRANASALRLGGSIIASSAQMGTQRHPNAPVQAAAVVAGGSHLERVPPPKPAAAFRGRCGGHRCNDGVAARAARRRLRSAAARPGAAPGRRDGVCCVAAPLRAPISRCRCAPELRCSAARLVAPACSTSAPARAGVAHRASGRCRGGASLVPGHVGTPVGGGARAAARRGARARAWQPRPAASTPAARCHGLS